MDAKFVDAMRMLVIVKHIQNTVDRCLCGTNSLPRNQPVGPTTILKNQYVHKKEKQNAVTDTGKSVKKEETKKVCSSPFFEISTTTKTPFSAVFFVLKNAASGKRVICIEWKTNEKQTKRRNGFNANYNM